MHHAHSSLGRHAGDGVLDGRIGLNGFHQPMQAALPGHRPAQGGGELGLAARPLQEHRQLLRRGTGRLRPGVLGQRPYGLQQSAVHWVRAQSGSTGHQHVTRAEVAAFLHRYHHLIAQQQH